MHYFQPDPPSIGTNKSPHSNVTCQDYTRNVLHPTVCHARDAEDRQCLSSLRHRRCFSSLRRRGQTMSLLSETQTMSFLSETQRTDTVSPSTPLLLVHGEDSPPASIPTTVQSCTCDSRQCLPLISCDSRPSHSKCCSTALFSIQFSLVYIAPNKNSCPTVLYTVRPYSNTQFALIHQFHELQTYKPRKGQRRWTGPKRHLCKRKCARLEVRSCKVRNEKCFSERH